MSINKNRGSGSSANSKVPNLEVLYESFFMKFKQTHNFYICIHGRGLKPSPWMVGLGVTGLVLLLIFISYCFTLIEYAYRMQLSNNMYVH